MKIKQELYAKPESPLDMWKRRLDTNRRLYERELAKMDEREAIYSGTTLVDAPASAGGGFMLGGERVQTVFNLTYELIEGQIDSSLPMPKVRSNREKSQHLAARAEEMIRAKMEQLPFEELNDQNERSVYIQGGAFALVEWDNTAGSHNSAGDLAVNMLHPRQLIPQAGICELEEMDYFFILSNVTRRFIRMRYGVDIPETSSETFRPQDFDGNAPPENTELVVLCTAYFKNDQGGIGKFVWAADKVLQDLEDYQARILLRCIKCGELANPDAQPEHKCTQCGGRLVNSAEQYEELTAPVYRSDGSEIPAMSPVLGEDGQPVLRPQFNPDGSLQTDQNGQPVMLPEMRPTRIPYYKPGMYPVVLRRNVSKYGSMLGTSDVDVTRPQQDAVKKLHTIIMEKLIKGGSYVTLPTGLKIETTDKQLKIVRVDSPAQKALIDVLNIQPDITLDMAALEEQYNKARSALGITDSYQGKPDSTAVSGVAKNILVQRTFGRLESKRCMKQAYYERIFRLMFRFMLAYADEPVEFAGRDAMGNTVFAEFNRYDYLCMDNAGNYYWDDNYLFGVDAGGGLAQNREAMWGEADRKYESGALGNREEDSTRLVLWTLMEQLQFPMAKAVKQQIMRKMENQEQNNMQMLPEYQPEQTGGLPPELAQLLQQEQAAVTPEDIAEIA